MSLLISFLLLAASVSAQRHFIADASDHKPLAGCLVILKGSTSNTLSTPEGSYDLPGKIKDELVFTLLGYETAVSPVVSLPDTVFLQRKQIQLNAVEVLAGRQLLNEKDERTILDFDFLNDNLVILYAMNGYCELSLRMPAGRELARLRVDGTASRLEQDCLGNLQMHCKDSVYQLYYDFTQLRLLYPQALERYVSVLGDCTCATEHEIFFRRTGYRNLEVRYEYYSDREQGKSFPLAAFADTAKISRFETDYDLNYFLEVRRRSFHSMYNEPIDSIKAKMKLYREALPLDWTYNKWLGAVATDMFKTNAVGLLNFTDSALYEVTPDMRLTLVSPVNELLRGSGLLKEVFADPVTSRAYVVFFDSHELLIRQFHSASGQALPETKVSGIPYKPSKILLFDGYVYYLQKDLSQQQSYKLYRCRLQI